VANVVEYKYSNEPQFRNIPLGVFRRELSSEFRHAESNTHLEQSIFYISFKLIQLLVQPKIVAPKPFISATSVLANFSVTHM
jgi:hypothetical protein